MKENNTTSTITSSTYPTLGFMPSCKYRLPCGICDRTGEYCSEFISYPCYPPWYYQVTCAQGTTIDAGHIKTGTITADIKENL